MKPFSTLAALSAISLLAACGGQNTGNTTSSSAGTAASSSASAPAAGSSVNNPKASVEAREQLMKQFKKETGTMGKMVKGETAFDAAEFQKAADTLDADANKPWEHFTKESANEESESKPEVWSKPDEFKKEIDKFTAATAALKTAAASGKIDDVKKPFGEVGQSCKSCHDSFKKD